MTLVTPTVPQPGDTAESTDVSVPVNQLAAVINGNLDDDNISSVSGTKIVSATVPATAMQPGANPETFRSEAGISFIASGCVWSAISGFNGQMTSGVMYNHLGARVAVAAVATKAFTASKDTYVSISNGTPAYNEVTNGASAPALPANSVWTYKVVTSGAAITSVADIRTTGVVPDASVTNAKLATGIDSAKLSNPYKFSVYRTGAQNSVNGYTKVLCEAETFDTSSNYDSVTNRRFTAPVAGFYQFSAGVAMGATATPVWQANLYKNGVLCKTGTLANINVGFQQSHVSGLIELAANDYVELWVYASAAVALAPGAVNTYLDGFLVSLT